METLEIKNRVAEVIYIFTKLLHTITFYKERYPELNYVKSFINAKQYDDETKINSDILGNINEYLKDQLSEYYSIRSMQRGFQEDINALKSGRSTSQEEFYLNI